MLLKMSSLFNSSTRIGLLEHKEGLGRSETDDPAVTEMLRDKYGLETLHRFDMGRNPDGYSPLLTDIIEFEDMARLTARNLTAYPDEHQTKLRKLLGERFKVAPDHILVTSGLTATIDMTARVFLGTGDRFLLPIPDYFLFEEYSARMGAAPVYIRLTEENHFQWTEHTMDEVVRSMNLFSPKLIWLSNPSNPTGRLIPAEFIDRIVAEAHARGVIVVVDEACGEYTDTKTGPLSAARLVPKFDNLLVMRTFSKIYGLPGARVGYVMCSSPEVLRALKFYRGFFSSSWFSLYVVQIAALDEDFVEEMRSTFTLRRMRFMEKIAALPSFRVLPSETNTLMLRSTRPESDSLWERLLKRGILTADQNDVPGLKNRGWVRIAVRDDETNQHLIPALMELDRN